MNCKEIIKKYLDDNGYDGLCHDECGCLKDDLYPCGECFDVCKPGHKITNEDGGWVICEAPKKEAK